MGVPSILMTVGREFYKLDEIIDEVRDIGLSKRIPTTGIPQGLIPGVSRVFLAHPDAIIIITAEGKTLQDLSYDMFELGVFTYDQWAAQVETDQPYWRGEDLKAGDFVPESMLYISYGFSRLPKDEQLPLIQKYGIKFQMGVFGYTQFGGIQVVLSDNENDLPEELEHLRSMVEDGYVEPVHVKYLEDEEDAG